MVHPPVQHAHVHDQVNVDAQAFIFTVRLEAPPIQTFDVTQHNIRVDDVVIATRDVIASAKTDKESWIVKKILLEKAKSKASLAVHKLDQTGYSDKMLMRQFYTKIRKQTVPNEPAFAKPHELQPWDDDTPADSSHSSVIGSFGTFESGATSKESDVQ